MKKMKFLLAFMAIAIAAAGVFAFTTPGKTAKKSVTYHYTLNSTDFSVMKNPANWNISSPEVGCGAIGTIPCTVTTSDDLGDYLDSFSDGDDLVIHADSRRD